MSETVYHVFTRPGDALGQVEDAVRALQARGVDRDAAGLYRAMYVTRADQTVVMTETRGSPLAEELRARGGWSEPGDRPLAG